MGGGNLQREYKEVFACFKGCLWILGFGVYYAGTISLRRYD